MTKVTGLPMTSRRRKSRDAHAHGLSSVERLASRGAVMPVREISFSGGGPRLESAPITRTVSPEGTALTIAGSALAAAVLVPFASTIDLVERVRRRLCARGLQREVCCLEKRGGKKWRI